YRQVYPRSPSRSRLHTLRGWRARAIPSQFDSLIKRSATEEGIDWRLVKAVVHAESAFRPQAVSPKGAMGLMQLMPATASRFGVRNAFDPEQNIRGGVRYLRFLLDRYEGNIRLALAAYNAGEGVVDQLGDVPPYRETIAYVRKVIDLHGQYRTTDGKSL
ncbi:MAG: lytic transglycosylase domain-containing protein, partial [Bdellovibrionales bacterium]|nr:lytic transglycosylase domain-containing protein [Bdellovibrionales bacterium]